MSSPIKLTWRSEFFPLLLIILIIILSIYWYPLLPERIASHWGINGEVNGYSSKFFMSWFLPLLAVGIYLLFLALPYLDPKKASYPKFASIYHTFKAALLTVIFIIFLATNLYNLGYNVPISLVMTVTIGLLMVVIGALLPRIEPNWFMGIRTPWTLSSPTVWKKTHEVGGKAFILFGLCLMISSFLPAIWAMIVLIGGIIALLLVTLVYSYIVYHQEQK